MLTLQEIVTMCLALVPKTLLSEETKMFLMVHLDIVHDNIIAGPYTNNKTKLSILIQLAES